MDYSFKNIIISSFHISIMYFLITFLTIPHYVLQTERTFHCNKKSKYLFLKSSWPWHTVMSVCGSFLWFNFLFPVFFFSCMMVGPHDSIMQKKHSFQYLAELVWINGSSIRVLRAQRFPTLINLFLPDWRFKSDQSDIHTQIILYRFKGITCDPHSSPA